MEQRSDVLQNRTPPITDAVPVDEIGDQTVETDSRRFTFILALGIVAALMAIGVYQWRLGPPDRGALAGEIAPLFALPSFRGTTLRLEDYRGKPVVLNFWASWCAPCRAEAATLARVATAQGEAVTFIGVNVRDRESDARAYLAEYGISYPTVRDVDGAVEPLYASVGIPFSVFISADGVIERTWIGPLDEQHLLAFVEELR
jgi:cytochrome c biogenesis protein CcmG/thiol:disulfide interchange protein DsbE